MSKKILECSRAGDSRFSAMCAKVFVNGVNDTIESHYQKSKAFLNGGKLYVADSPMKAKGKKPVAFNISGYYLPLEYGAMFYDLMWYKYIKANPELETILEQYDEYSDMYKSKIAHNCQADSIRKYMRKDGVLLPKEQRGFDLMKDCAPLLDFLNGKSRVIVVKGDIFNGYANIIGHQVNCRSVMGAGIAKTIKEKYRKACEEYLSYSKTHRGNLLGSAQVVDCGDKYICNIYAQDGYGRDKTVVYTSYEALEKSLRNLKSFAMENNLVISLPYGIGCGLANGNWNKVSKIIHDVFSDYYVVLYKYD